MSDHDDTKAKMLALLALLDVLQGSAEMTAVGTEKIGPADPRGRAGKIRLRFTVFGEETRLLTLAHELTVAGSQAEMMREVMCRIDRDDKLRFAARMIETWTEVLQRLLAAPAVPVLESGTLDGRTTPVRPFLHGTGTGTGKRLPEGKP